MQITYDSSRIHGLQPGDRILVERSDDGGLTWYWRPTEMSVAQWRRGFRSKHERGRCFTAFRAWPYQRRSRSQERPPGGFSA
jgi:hypothetical protein